MMLLRSHTSVIDENVHFTKLLDSLLDDQMALLHRVCVEQHLALLHRNYLVSQLLDYKLC